MTGDAIKMPSGDISCFNQQRGFLIYEWRCQLTAFMLFIMLFCYLSWWSLSSSILQYLPNRNFLKEDGSGFVEFMFFIDFEITDTFGEYPNVITNIFNNVNWWRLGVHIVYHFFSLNDIVEEFFKRRNKCSFNELYPEEINSFLHIISQYGSTEKSFVFNCIFCLIDQREDGVYQLFLFHSTLILAWFSQCYLVKFLSLFIKWGDGFMAPLELARRHYYCSLLCYSYFSMWW